METVFLTLIPHTDSHWQTAVKAFRSAYGKDSYRQVSRKERKILMRLLARAIGIKVYHMPKTVVE